jgi:hypothetical protein
VKDVPNLPAVVVDGKLASCCSGRGPEKLKPGDEIKADLVVNREGFRVWLKHVQITRRAGSSPKATIAGRNVSPHPW